MEGVKFLMSESLGAVTHPLLCVDALTKGDLQVTDQSDHTLFR